MPSDGVGGGTWKEGKLKSWKENRGPLQHPHLVCLGSCHPEMFRGEDRRKVGSSLSFFFFAREQLPFLILVKCLMVVSDPTL